MTSQQLEIFISAARNLNFTRTAEECHTTQPTISRQISLLEEEWGFPLFIRTNREVRLTPEGTVMWKRVQDAMHLIDDGICQVMEHGAEISGTLKIGYLEAMDSDFFVMPTAVFFSKNYPNIEISLESRSFAELRDKLENGSLDLIFTLSFELANFADAAYGEYYPVSAGLTVSRSHPLAELDHIDPERFSREVFYLPYPEDSPHRTETLKKILRRMGIDCQRIRYAGNQESMLLQVRTGRGVGFLDTSVRSILNTDFYRFFEVPKEIAPLSVTYVWKRENYNPALALYISTLTDNEFIDVYNN